MYLKLLNGAAFRLIECKEASFHRSREGEEGHPHSWVHLDWPNGQSIGLNDTAYLLNNSGKTIDIFSP